MGFNSGFKGLSFSPPQTRWQNHSSISCNLYDFRCQAGRL